MKGLYLLTCLAITGTACPVLAHHSDAGYDRDRLVTFEGVVSRYIFRNPHIMIHIETGDGRGGITEWEIETGSTPIMSRSGWSSSMLRPGDVVTVRVHPERSGANKAILNVLETSDGGSWSQIEVDEEATATATSISGIWKGIGATTGAFRSQLNAHALTSAGNAAKEQFSYFEDSLIPDCVPPQAPDAVIGSIVYLNEIEVMDDQIIIRSEFFDTVRTVYMDGRGHPENGEHTNQGHSIGRWEDDVLIIDTTLFSDHPDANGRGVPAGASKHLIERVRLSDDRTQLTVDFLLEDPEYLAEPFAASKALMYTPHLEMITYDCDPVLSRQIGFN
tara:strand:- start:639 stop:1637 length:999 start_codon:yes stop_codon:yes gene_type:complete